MAERSASPAPMRGGECECNVTNRFEENRSYARVLTNVIHRRHLRDSC